MMTLCIMNTFYFGGKAGMNTGVLSSFYVTSVVFTVVIFYFLYGQKVSKSDLIGASFIMLCVILISTGSADDNIEKKNEFKYTIFAIMFAIMAAFCFSLRPLTVQYSMDLGVDISQSFYDCNLMGFIIVLPFLAFQKVSFEWVDIITASASLFFGSLGHLLYGFGIQYGVAGPVEAIENIKCIWITLFATIF